ncbi:MAG: radical SAM protein [Candidatus Auribacter fodinae]|uniref:Radical SAM protein n=1 Tax=Candidatus Auribacter fodinae TaxID=2093366 RepID=A0A3A4QZI3_9BACT|nr:MAG: radical SAM protein [Candidatus Auribacter fodinae]
MKILLINPKRVGRGQSSIRYMNSTPLALPTLKALTPDDVDVRIVDENHDSIPYDEYWDLVGITVMLHVSPSAIEIAKAFRQRGTKVAFGGFFPTLWPHDAAPHVDTIIAGEAEHIWAEVISDLRKNKLKPFYKADHYIDLKDIPFIKKEYFSKDDEFYHVETTRGCPYNCDFCSVTAFYGAKFRHRPIDDVVKQVAEFKDKMIFFVDDNITGNAKYARELFKAIIPLKIKWSGQFSLNNAERHDVMELAAESGCQFLFTGIESLNLANLQAVDKKWGNPEKFGDWLRFTHDAGIGVYGSFMFGFEDDHKDIFKRTLDFCEENKIELALFSALFPIKGSKFHAQLMKENRIFETDPTRFNGQYSTFHPKHMTAQELDEGLRWLWQEFYSKRSMKVRLSEWLPKLKEEKSPNGGLSNTAETLAALNTAFRVAVGDF